MRDLVVVDYKFGGAPFIGRELLEGHGSQLFAYIKSVENKYHLMPAAGFYVRIGRTVDAKKGFFLKDHNKILHTTHHANSGLLKTSFEDAFSLILLRWEEAARNLKDGNFIAKPYNDKICRSCSYQDICSYEREEP